MRRAAVLCLALGLPSLAGADTFQVIETHETVVQDLRRITTTVQNGDSPINRFIVERVLPAGRSPQSLRPIILAPGLGFNHKSYTLGLQPGGGDFESSIAANLARGGADVFLYSTRQALLSPGACDTTNCVAAKKWGLQARVRDFDFIRNQIAAEHGSVKPVVGGISLGGGTAVAAVNQHPNAYAGLIMIETAAAPHSDPTTRAGYQTFCDGFRAQLAAGQVWSNDLVAALGALSMANTYFPDMPYPGPGFLPGTTYRQAFLLVMGTPSPGPPDSPFLPGLALSATSVWLPAFGMCLSSSGNTPVPCQDRFLYASENVVASQLANINAYTPTAELVDITCSAAGDVTFTDRLGAFTGPVLAIEAQLGVGAGAQSTLDLLGTPEENIQVRFVPGLAHADLLFVPDHAARLEKPILEWLESTQD